jgi:signal transduction histidine kinase
MNERVDVDRLSLPQPTVKDRTLLDALPIAIAIASDPTCERLEINAAAARLFGLPPEEAWLNLYGTTKLPFRLMRKGVALPLDQLPVCAIARGEPAPQRLELDLVREDGSVVKLYHDASPPLGEAGMTRGCVGIFCDLSRSPESIAEDQRVLGMLDTLPDPFAILTPVREPGGRIVDFLFQYINYAGAESNRHTREEQIGHRMLEFVPYLRDMGVFDAYVKLVETGETVDRGFIHAEAGEPAGYYEVWATRFGDAIAVRWRRTAGRPDTEQSLRDSEARLRVLNETLEARVRERTAEANARAEQLRDLALDLAESESRERKRFAQLLHDHFQQLVSAAKLRAGIIRRKATTPELRDAVQQIEQLLVQAIDASRTLATQLSPPVLHDAGLVPAVESIVRGTERDHGLAIKFIGEPTAEPANERIRLILFETARELLQNVVQHSFAKTARVEVNVVNQPTPAIRIAVIDEGKGFDVKQAKFIHNDDKPFGLLRIQERIRYIGGDVRIDSRLGEGSTIEAIVPCELRRPVKEAPRTAAAAAAPFADATTGPAGGMTASPRGDGRVLRIIVADDHRLFRDGLTSLLAHEPYLQIVGEAADGETAITLARQLRPDVLICDISMPKRNGVEVTATLSREIPEMRIIGLSMHEREDMANAMRAAGASAYLTKSGPSDLLLGILRTFVTPVAK